MTAAHDDATMTTAEAGPAWQAAEDGPPRFLHRVWTGEVEYVFWDLDRALAKLEEEPEAELELITVH